jgi:dipeptidyl aminopeptidase/acylaminoacyl peptidase
LSTDTVSLAPSLAAVADPRLIESSRRSGVRRLSLEALFTTRVIGGSAWSPDGRTIAFVSNLSGRNNLWLVPAEGGWPRQLTISDQRQASPAWSPDSRWIAFISDYDGNEQWDLFIVSPETGDVVNLTQTPDVSEESPVWSPDSKWLAFISKPRKSSSFEIELIEPSTGRRSALTSGTSKEWGNFQPLWSPDGQRIAFTRTHATGKNSSIWMADLLCSASPASLPQDAVELTPHEDEHLYSAVDWSPDGRTLLVSSDAAGDCENVALLDIESRRLDWLTRERWEIVPGNFSPDGRTITWSANVEGNTDLYLYERASRMAHRLPLPGGVNHFAGSESSFSRDGGRLLFYHNGPDSPTELWIRDLDSAEATGRRLSANSVAAPVANSNAGALHRVTYSTVASLRPDDMVEPRLVHYPSRDGRWQISAFAYVPFNIERVPRHPAVVYVHGGPQSQTVNSFNRIVQLLVNRGYLVIAPNYRGSTGYGKAFQDANRFDMGGGDLQDVLGAADWMRQTGYVDPNKLVIMGGSYGGYMTMMGVTKAPEVWAAGVAIVPFVNWFTEVENEDPLLREYDLATMGDPVANRELWRDRSPIFFVDRVRAPLLLLAGAHDPRCPEEETRQVAEAIRARGGVVEVKIYANEGHGFSRIENQIDAYQTVAAFLARHVPPLTA